MAMIPLTILPLILYNIVAFFAAGSLPPDPWSAELFAATMVSGARFAFSLGDLMLVIGIVVLFFEIFRATRFTTPSIVNHMVSTLVLVIFAIEFVLVPQAAHPVFLILGVTALFDVLAGFIISIRSARRDIALESPN
ncbi:hypothetical protein [Prosthecomicrobium pneumaticum]|uniref:Transmembrane protein n=1 Tax=Prosthecomicrobium pneumaticum TaxID=81895 RepID=A0A7W9FQI8_9HYPH|nr:hypothetical protein [Prosthecomicrobium pneumaticum]MBB5754937.1 hypothetical protein [Prosthecomicrobium pneumaticum]